MLQQHLTRSPQSITFQSTMKQGELLYQSLRTLRMRAVEDIEMLTALHFHAHYSQLLAAGEMHHRITVMRQQLEAAGVVRHQMRRLLTQVVEESNRVRRLLESTITKNCIGFYSEVLVGYEKEFVEEDGSLMPLLHQRFHDLIAEPVELARIGSKQCFDNMGHDNSQLLSYICIARGMSDFACGITDSCNKRLYSLVGVKDILPFAGQLSSIAAGCVNILRMFVDVNQTLPTKQAEDATAYFQRLTDIITSNKVIEIYNRTQKERSLCYIEFFIARLRMDIESGFIPFYVKRTLLHKLADKSTVLQFLAEVHSIPLYEGVEAYDLSFDVTPQHHAPVLDNFRSLAYRMQRRYSDKEVHRERLRQLTNELNENGGALPLGTLKHLYRELGTKSAVSKLVDELGPAGAATKRVLKGLKVEDLKDDEKV